MKVEFKFEIDQKVKTIFDEYGIVDMAAIDNTNKESYYVKVKGGKGDWFKVDQLRAE